MPRADFFSTALRQHFYKDTVSSVVLQVFPGSSDIGGHRHCAINLH